MIRRKIGLIGVPSSAGAHWPGQEKAPRALREAGLAAWIVQRWRDWSDCGGCVESRFSTDELLTNVMIYWVTRTIATSLRFYYGWAANTPQAPKGMPSRLLDPGERIEVPSAPAVFQSGPPRAEAQRACDLRRYTVMPRDGHFAAMEEPELLVEDIRYFFRPLRSRQEQVT